MSLIPRAEADARRSAAMRKPKAPEANRARIVKAAIDEFASRGFKGASMDAIAARTHTTRALINYYFGGKEKLYIAVLEQVYSEIREAEAALGMFNVTNRYTFGAIFQREMGSKGDVARRRDVVADMIISYLTNLQRNPSGGGKP